MRKQYSNTLFMVEPIDFRYNEETAVNNYFQNKTDEANELVQKKALDEFNNFAAKLREKGANVIVLKDTKEPHTPDSIFPNNWITFHKDGRIALYPMYAQNRRLERRPEEVMALMRDNGFNITEVVDYSKEEEKGVILEGTGSIILDRVNMIAYACVSPRTNRALFERFCKDFGYKPVVWESNQTVDGKRMQIYHTNVVMCIGDDYVIITLSTIDNAEDRKKVVASLEGSGKEIIEITEEQMHKFAGNMLQVGGSGDSKYLVMSDTAYNALTKEQIATIEKYNPILTVDINTIEVLGGGSARCMLAEVFLPKK
ncbi:MAG: amidinotransferase [Bacteroidales bacterium]|nr:amidinotransferase [Bacteroidales bacterium]